MLDYFESKVPEPEEKLPEWVSKDNASIKAYEALVDEYTRRIEYIKSCSRITQFNRKKSYKIFSADIARKIGITNTTLLATSKYSEGFKQQLDKYNNELQYAKDERVNKIRAQKSKGPIARNKDELVSETKSLKSQNKKLKNQNIEKQVSQIISSLHLDVRRKLFGE